MKIVTSNRGTDIKKKISAHLRFIEQTTARGTKTNAEGKTVTIILSQILYVERNKVSLANLSCDFGSMQDSNKVFINFNQRYLMENPTKSFKSYEEPPPSVAICYPSGRVNKITVPMNAANIPVEVEPNDPYAHDVIIFDQSDKSMIIPLIRSDNNTPVLYRVRGNFWRSSKYTKFGTVKKHISGKFVLPFFDGALLADSWLETEWQNRVGNTDTTSVGLAVQPEEWPSITHTDHELRLLTLTNADYRGKVDPIIEWMSTVDEVLDKLGGQWTIGGSGRFEEDIHTAAMNFENIEFEGFLDAEKYLSESNAYLHPSMFDIQLPNAILEAMASVLPVVTTDFPPFAAHCRLLSVTSERQLGNLLHQLHDPVDRQREGERNLKFVCDEHSPKMIGNQYREFLQSLK